MDEETGMVFQHDRNRNQHSKSKIYLPQKQGSDGIIYIHIDDPPLDLSRRRRREDGEEVEVSMDSPVLITTKDYTNLQQTTIGNNRRATITTTGAVANPSAPKLYKCCECDYVSKRSYDVRRHMKTHGNTRPYGCPQCAHTARDSASLRAHMLQKHGNLDQYVCPRCDYSSNRQAELARHIRVHHEPR